jgi:hypothetical protein
LSGFLNPEIQVISKTLSPFTFYIKFKITNLPSNQLFELWSFFPDGEAVGGQGFSSDDKGNAIDSQGRNETPFMHSSSNIRPNGKYIFGIILGNFLSNKRIFFNDWQNSPNLKYFIKIDLSCIKETILILNKIENVPLGLNATVNGHLWFKNVKIEEPLLCSSGGAWLNGRKIYFTGTNKYSKSIETDVFSKFSTKFEVDNKPENGCFIQAHYDGDNKYFDKCQSNLVYYSIIKHKTALTIKIDNLKINLFNKYNSNKIILESNQFFRIKGNLIDIDADMELKLKKLKLKQICQIPIFQQ